ncbi:sensor histidine kinase [Siphonobacter aquaeclarae]|uniref:Histidine kinase n=1 Tax=Siphonobacter aquaeclarae TaxID=563176 RepID=A0A1G9LBP5_9BACT|nr:sensor histidine kinase [Siphonobacter aquaeclarae]SDL58955.1 Histidine kinase [Siphonobacter aquaeclarae]
MVRIFSYDFIFSRNPRIRLWRHGIFWLGWIIFSVLIYLPVNARSGDGSWGDVVTVTLFETLLFTVFSHAVFAYLLAYWLIPRFFYTRQFGWFVVGFLFIMVLQAFCAFCVGQVFARPFRLTIGFPARSGNLWYGMLAGVRGGMTVGGFLAAIVIMKNLFRQQELTASIQQEKLSAELQLLKSQIHPHFLFNTLNNLYSLTLKSSPESPQVVLKLSSLLRYILYECNAPTVLLEKEVAFLKDYVELEQLRYGRRLDVSQTFSGNFGDCFIAPLLLVPFVENAFKHGTSQQLDQAWISLDLAVEEKTLNFRLINSHDPTYAAQSPGGIGLVNVRKRLDLLYPGAYELKMIREEETFLVAMTLRLA